MILRGFHVEHWRCIGKLDLDDLPAGVVVLHGPNRTGKSSLVRALRYSLFDADHDTTGKEFKKNLPWHGNGPPRIAVEFETDGAVYRLTKVFSKRADGTALLEKKIGLEWRVEEDAPKEASRRVRELLGMDKSTSGLNQLLWLEQGEIGLPEPDRLDHSLQKQLVGVLGMMVTGRDLAFRQALDKRYYRWFTEKRGIYREDCGLRQWENKRQERLQRRDEEDKKFRELEQAIGRLEACADDLPARHTALEKADREWKQLKQESETCRERLRQFGVANQAHENARQNLHRALDALQKFEAATSRIESSAKAAAQAQDEVNQAAQDYARLTELHQRHAAALEQVRQGEQAHQHTREEIDDRRALLMWAQRQCQLAMVLKSVHDLAQEIDGLEEAIKKLLAPDEKALAVLRTNRRQAQILTAQLQASGLSLGITVSGPMAVRLGLDGQPQEPAELAPGQKKSWSLRQRATIDLGDALIELARTQEDLDLERSAGELAKLDRAFQDAMGAYGEDANDDCALDRLAERRMQRETWAKRLKEARQDLREQAPEGGGALEGELQQGEQQRKIILRRRPELTGWQPSRADLEVSERQFRAEAAERAATLKQYELEEKRTRQEAQQAERTLQKKKEVLAAAAATANAAREEVQRLGDEAALRQGALQAQEAVSQALHRVEECRLTEAEQTIEQRCQDAENALQQRRTRLREAEDQVTQLRGFLHGNEGLHTRLADAEANLLEADLALARERVEAEAHRKLRELFEECRENQVQQVMGPIAGRVLEWAKRVGLDEYQEVRFGDKFLPENLVLGSNTPVALSDESYGTAEQLSLLVRLALGGVLARDEPVVALLDDPLAHADPAKHRRILDVLRLAAEGNAGWNPPAGRLQIIILTCHPDRFDHLAGAHHYDLGRLIARS